MHKTTIVSLTAGFLSGVTTLYGAEILDRLQPSALTSTCGRVSEVSFTSEVTTLKSGVLAFCSDGSMKMFEFPEPVWVIGYKTEVKDAQGEPPIENYLCHTFFGDHMPKEGDDSAMKSLYSDAFTREIRLPDGFGVPMKTGEKIHWMPMFNNRADRKAEVRMTFRVFLIRERDRIKLIQPLYSTLRSVENPHLYFVPPGKHAKSTTFTLPFDGRVHFMGTHVHPYAESVELVELTRGQTLWKSSPRRSVSGEFSAMETYSSAEGIPLRPGARYALTATYNNPTDHWVDAMAGLFLFFTNSR
jgi:hypothetical protein